jgi:hypothetical protein
MSNRRRRDLVKPGACVDPDWFSTKPMQDGVLVWVDHMCWSGHLDPVEDWALFDDDLAVWLDA